MTLGFEPVFSKSSRLLILGSFPSEKSREAGFYYGNPRNRFWPTICSYFGDAVPEGADGKREWLSRRDIALWDVVESCDVTGSADATIRNVSYSDLGRIFKAAKIELVLLNGSKAYELFMKKWRDISVRCLKMVSTSPASTKFFDPAAWHAALDEVFKK